MANPGPPEAHSDLNYEWLTRALNYHGQQLTSFLSENPSIDKSSLKSVNYHEYQSRAKDLSMEERGKRILLYRFIAQKAEVIFDRNARVTPTRTPTRTPTAADAVVPPIEAFMEVDHEMRTTRFFEVIQPGQVFYGTVIAKNQSGLMIQVLAFHPAAGFNLHLKDLKIRSFLPASEMVQGVTQTNRPRAYENHDLVTVIVLEVKRDSQRILATMKPASVAAEGVEVNSEGMTFGLTSRNDLPLPYKLTQRAHDENGGFQECLAQTKGFINPTSVASLAEELGLPSKSESASLCPSLRGSLDPYDSAKALRKRQNAKWAFNHVASGIQHFKGGNYIEAFQCLNQALKIDPINVEGLVARGALYANNGSLEKAVTDFEEAMTHDPNHRNAKKYLGETLLAIGRNCEETGQSEKAVQVYEKILKVNPSHPEALNALSKLVRKSGVSSGIPGLEVGVGADIASLLASKQAEMEAARRRRASGGSSDGSTKRRKRSESPFSKREAASGGNPAVSDGASSAAGYSAVPQFDFSAPPPGYHPGYPPAAAMGYAGYQKSREDLDYDRKVQDFLQQTKLPSKSSLEKEKEREKYHREREARERGVRERRSKPSPKRESRSRKRSGDRAKRSRSKETKRAKKRSKSKDKSRRKRSRSSSSSSSSSSSRSRSRSKDRKKKKSEKSSSSKKEKSKKKSKTESDSPATTKKAKKKSKKTEGSDDDLEAKIKNTAKELLKDIGNVDEVAAKLSAFFKESSVGKDKEVVKKKSSSEVKSSSEKNRSSRDYETLDSREQQKKKERDAIFDSLPSPRRAEAEAPARRERTRSPPLKRVSSPGVKAAFEMDGGSSSKASSSKPLTIQMLRERRRDASKNQGPKPLWKPEESQAETLSLARKAVAELEERNSRSSGQSDLASGGKRKFSEYPDDVKIRIRNDVATSNSGFEVKLDRNGMYTRVPKDPPSRHESQDERRIIRKVSRSPPRSPNGKERHWEDRRDKDELQGMISETQKLREEREAIEKEKQALLAQERDYMSFSSLPNPVPVKSSEVPKPSASRDPLPERRSRSRSPPRYRSRSPPKYRPRSRSPLRSYPTNGGRGERSPSRYNSNRRLPSPRSSGRPRSRSPRDRDYRVREDTVRIPDRREIEGKWGEERRGAGPSGFKEIIPGAKSFEELEDLLNKTKREKKEKMSKNFMRPRSQW